MRRDYPFWKSMTFWEKALYIIDDYWDWLKWVLFPLLVTAGALIGHELCKLLDWAVALMK